MSVEVKINEQSLKAVDDAATKALISAARRLQEEIKDAQVIPMKTGHLQEEGFDIDAEAAENGDVRLIFDTPYAARLYFHPEFNFNHEHNANVQGLWMEPWKPGGVNGDRFAELLAEEMKKEL